MLTYVVIANTEGADGSKYKIQYNVPSADLVLKYLEQILEMEEATEQHLVSMSITASDLPDWVRGAKPLIANTDLRR